MKTMGLADLRLVAPEKFPAPEARWMATNAIDVLDQSKIHASLAKRIADCVAAFALSARPREWSTQVLDVRAAAARAVELDGDVAFVFGNEQAGPDQRGNARLPVPRAHPGQSGIQLAQSRAGGAGGLLRTVHGVRSRRSCKCRTEKPATVADLEGLYGHLEQAAVESEFFDPASDSKLRTRLRRLFSRVPDLEREEVNILRGLLNALQNAQIQIVESFSRAP